MSQAKSRTTPNPAPRHALTLSPAHIEVLEELCVLTSSTMGFCLTPEMIRACDAVANKISPAAKLAYLARATKREHLELFA